MTETLLMADEKRINLKVDEDLHARLKAQAALQRTTLQDLVTEWLREKLADAERPRERRE